MRKLLLIIAICLSANAVIAQSIDSTNSQTVQTADSTGIETTLPVDSTGIETAQPVDSTNTETTQPVDSTGIETAQPVDSTNTETTQPVDSTNIETAPIDSTNIEVVQPIDSINIETAQPVDSTNIETVQSIDSTNIETAQLVDSTNIKTAESIEIVETLDYWQYTHELSAWGGIGFPSLCYDLSFGDHSGKIGFLGGLGYNYFLDYNWSVGIGAEFSALYASLDISNFNDYYVIPTFGGMNDPLNLEVEGHEYAQKYIAYYINVPLTARYQFDVWKRHKFYAAGGLKIGIPVSAKFATQGNYEALGHEPDEDIIGNTGDTYDNILKAHGFGHQEVDFKNGTWATKWNWILTLEAGMKWRLNDKLALYSGVFVDYGLNDIRKGDRDKHIINYIEMDNGLDYYKNNTPALNAVYASKPNGSVQSFTDRVSTFAVGLKVQLAFGLKPASKLNGSSVQSLTDDKVSSPAIRKRTRKAAETTPPIPVHVVNQADPNAEELSKIANTIVEMQNAIKALLTKEEGYLLKSVYGFDLDKTAILATMTTNLMNNLDVMRKHPNIKVLLIGHTDDYATHEYNIDLGLRRALVIRDWLIANGIDAERISIATKGKTQPAIPNLDEKNRRYNRRVIFEEVKEY
ncbi:MAG: OmpA family protein [Prevotellaceae bacterium]|jgi:outer membrane protein OmpA-like peptidoglycan-associated protein|nr:OmpA family protein [Prevotellaceae bacterium]